MGASDEKSRVEWLTQNLVGARSRTLGGVAFDVGLVLGAEQRDDCAVIEVRQPLDLVIGSDYVRGPKFLLFETGYLSLRDIGRFCVTANVSDVAAMGAVPIGFLSVVRYDRTISDSDFREVMLGIDEGCKEYGIALLGGDTGSAERLILSGTALGVAERGASLRRSSARPDDVVVVSGRVGAAGAAVLAAASGILDDISDNSRAALLDAWRLPVAQPHVGKILSSSGLRIACQDISDGLRSTLAELASSSGVAIVADLDAVPLGEGVAEVADSLGVPDAALAISASTDFRLCFTCSASDYEVLERAMMSQGEKLWVVGRCEQGEGVWVDATTGGRKPAPGVEWRHQDGDIDVVVLNGLREQAP